MSSINKTKTGVKILISNISHNPSHKKTLPKVDLKKDLTITIAL